MTKRQEYAPVGDLLVKNLLAMARGYIAANVAAGRKKILLSSVSRACHGDAGVLDTLAEGKGSITMRKYDEAMAKLYERWPEGQGFPVLPFKVEVSATRAKR